MAPAGLTSLALCITALAATMWPYFAARADVASIIAWFVQLTMAQQSLTWAVARLCSFPAMELLRAPVAATLPVVGSMLVCFIGEALGSAVQFHVMQCAPILLHMAVATSPLEFPGSCRAQCSSTLRTASPAFIDITS